MSVPVQSRFGVLLAQKRIEEKRPIPLSEVAEATGISRPTLYAWENNTVTRYDAMVIEQLCRYFGVDVGGLLVVVDE